MNYKAWSWISLGISIFFLLITISIQNANTRTPIVSSPDLHIEYDSEIPDSIRSYYDTIISRFKVEYDKIIRLEVELEKLYHSSKSGKDNTLFELYKRTKTTREQLEREYNETLKGLGIVKQDDLLHYYMEERRRFINQDESETQDSGFTKLSGTASILGLFFTFFFRYKDIKKRRKDIEKQENPLQPLDTRIWNADLSDKDNGGDKKRADLSIDEKTYDNGYETTLTIRNNGETEAKNVMVEVLPDKEQNETNARIVNSEILPKETVYPKGSFQVTVECWYPKAYRDVVVTWEDTKPRKVVQNVQLSKNYVV